MANDEHVALLTQGVDAWTDVGCEFLVWNTFCIELLNTQCEEVPMK